MCPIIGPKIGEFFQKHPHWHFHLTILCIILRWLASCRSTLWLISGSTNIPGNFSDKPFVIQARIAQARVQLNDFHCWGAKSYTEKLKQEQRNRKTDYPEVSDKWIRSRLRCTSHRTTSLSGGSCGCWTKQCTTVHRASHPPVVQQRNISLHWILATQSSFLNSFTQLYTARHQHMDLFYSLACTL